MTLFIAHYKVPGRKNAACLDLMTPGENVSFLGKRQRIRHWAWFYPLSNALVSFLTIWNFFFFLIIIEFWKAGRYKMKLTECVVEATGHQTCRDIFFIISWKSYLDYILNWTNLNWLLNSKSSRDEEVFERLIPSNQQYYIQCNITGYITQTLPSFQNMNA